ncbi:hypothetical protein BpHYR1_045139 [Brachionus plicatilis]|uniref:Uncharacterized protein n=1 Tax=Brachionus plicatilis TaxID=10195 RepID=A0A3M7QQL4_BRAPC|nr:hypothetical protein BpHYR1_045139 [Brachionus plicatilis]
MRLHMDEPFEDSDLLDSDNAPIRFACPLNLSASTTKLSSSVSLDILYNFPKFINLILALYKLHVEPSAFFSSFFSSFLAEF